jgi:hypothetical protein
MFIEHYSVIEMYIPSHYYTHVTPKPDRAVAVLMLRREVAPVH